MDISFTEGGPNVFVDLGLPDADELLVKAKLTHRIAVSIRDRGLSQSEAARLMGLPQPKLSTMLRGQFRGVSEDKMMRCLVALGHDITIRISEPNAAVGRVDVELA